MQKLSPAESLSGAEATSSQVNDGVSSVATHSAPGDNSAEQRLHRGGIALRINTNVPMRAVLQSQAKLLEEETDDNASSAYISAAEGRALIPPEIKAAFLEILFGRFFHQYSQGEPLRGRSLSSSGVLWCDSVSPSASRCASRISSPSCIGEGKGSPIVKAALGSAALAGIIKHLRHRSTSRARSPFPESQQLGLVEYGCEPLSDDPRVASRSRRRRQSGSSSDERRHKRSSRVRGMLLSESTADLDEERASRVLHIAARQVLVSDTPLLACPFCKWKPLTYRDCRKKILREIARVKLHLWRCHEVPIHCAICYAEFDTTAQRDEHLRQRACVLCESPKQWDGITADKKERLKKRVNTKLSKSEQWYDMCRILFPDAPLPDSPFLEGALSQELVELQDFMAEEWPPIFDNLVEKRLPPGLRAQQDLIKSFSKGLFEEALTKILNKYETSRDDADAATTAVSESGDKFEAAESAKGVEPLPHWASALCLRMLVWSRLTSAPSLMALWAILQGSQASPITSVPATALRCCPRLRAVFSERMPASE